MRSTDAASAGDGRFSTHSPVRIRFPAVFDALPSPRTQRQPSQNADDIGARLAVPFSFIVLISTTGVPKYRMLGSLGTCGAFIVLVLIVMGSSSDGAPRGGAPRSGSCSAIASAAQRRAGRAPRRA
jgi:hypothetical protein